MNRDSSKVAPKRASRGPGLGASDRQRRTTCGRGIKTMHAAYGAVVRLQTVGLLSSLLNVSTVLRCGVADTAPSGPIGKADEPPPPCFPPFSSFAGLIDAFVDVSAGLPTRSGWKSVRRCPPIPQACCALWSIVPILPHPLLLSPHKRARLDDPKNASRTGTTSDSRPDDRPKKGYLLTE